MRSPPCGVSSRAEHGDAGRRRPASRADGGVRRPHQVHVGADLADRHARIFPGGDPAGKIGDIVATRNLQNDGRRFRTCTRPGTHDHSPGRLPHGGAAWGLWVCGEVEHPLGRCTAPSACGSDATVHGPGQVELCDAPPFGSAADPVNFAGTVAAEVLRDDMSITHLDAAAAGVLSDVRELAELAVEEVADVVIIPPRTVAIALGRTSGGRPILVICRSGQRAYAATRCLVQNGFDGSRLGRNAV